MNTFDRARMEKTNSFRSIFGLILLISGGILFLDQYLKTGWLSLLVLPAVGLYLFVYGLRIRNARMMLSGGMLAGAGVGAAAALNPLVVHQPIYILLALLAVATAVIWLATAIAIPVYTSASAWWVLVPVGLLAAYGTGVLFTPMRWIDFVLTLGLGLGISLLAWSLITRTFGLLIPGSLIVTIGLGIYFAWTELTEANTLLQTGVMLVWFALGWILISLGARVMNRKYVWWPLIPGGILAVVGLGLYIGGDPGNALGFISNTGAIVLMVFGLYLLLMRKGIHHD
jgi:hypothetical protein